MHKYYQWHQISEKFKLVQKIPKQSINNKNTDKSKCHLFIYVHNHKIYMNGNFFLLAKKKKYDRIKNMR